MRTLIIVCLLAISNAGVGQNTKISTIDFVQIVDNNKEEAIFYFKNNWEVLRNMALDKDYIESYQVLEDPDNDDDEFQLILVTTYANKKQFKNRENHFQKLIEQKGELKLLNHKKPVEFRKTVFSKEILKHWN